MNDSADDRQGWWRRLSGGLKRTSASIGAAIGDVVVKRRLDRAMVDELFNIVNTVLPLQLVLFLAQVAPNAGVLRDAIILGAAYVAVVTPANIHAGWQRNRRQWATGSPFETGWQATQRSTQPVPAGSA